MSAPRGFVEAARRAAFRARASVWAPVAARGLAAACGLLVLTAIGSGALAGPFLGPGAAMSAAVVASAAPSASVAAGAGGGVQEGAAGDAGVTVDAAAADAGSAAPAGITPDGKVVLNLATEDDLRKLPGVGPVKARAILALRARLGKFRKPEELLRVKGLGRKGFARIRPLLLLDPPGG